MKPIMTDDEFIRMQWEKIQKAQCKCSDCGSLAGEFWAHRSADNSSIYCRSCSEKHSFIGRIQPMQLAHFGRGGFMSGQYGNDRECKCVDCGVIYRGWPGQCDHCYKRRRNMTYAELFCEDTGIGYDRSKDRIARLKDTWKWYYG